MRTIGLIGGMSWESTVPYYRHINRRVAERLGGLHSARLLLYSVDFHDVEKLQRDGRWTEAGELLADVAVRLEGAGAELLVLCTNTMHRVAPAIEAAADIPLLHIADATGRAVRDAGLRRIGLLGTSFTMEMEFYRGRLQENWGLEVLVPGPEARKTVHRVIYEELCLGIERPQSREAYRGIVGELLESGAEGVVLGCTEIGLLLRSEDVDAPLFDTSRIHAEAAADAAMAATPPEEPIAAR